MKMIDNENVKLIGIVWSIAVVMTIAAYNFVIVPQTMTKKSFKTKLAEKKQLVEFAQNMADEKKRQKLDKDIEQLRKELGKYVVDFENSSNLTFDISQIANEKRVSEFSIRTIGHGENKAFGKSDDIYEKHVKVKFNAGFNQFVAMLNALERHQPVFFIDNFKIKRAKKNNTKNNTVDMDISFLMKKGQEG